MSYTIVNDVNDIRKIRKICNDNNNTRGSICNLIQQLNFDTVIIDLNIGNHDGIEVAKEVLEFMPWQRIIFTTTVYFDIIKAKTISQGLLSPITILQKPFKFSDLLSIISPSKGKFDRVKLTDHVLASYDTIQEELMDTVDFIKKGIELDEVSLLLIRKDMDIKNTIHILRSNGLFKIESLLKNKSLIILVNEDWYIPDGKVNKNRIINQ